MAIGPDGERSVYAGPIIASSDGVQPLAPRPATAVSPVVPIQSAINLAAQRHQLSPQLVEAVAWQESRFHQNAVSPKGARGIMQLMPGTAGRLGVDSASLSANLDGGAAYLSELLARFDGDIIKTLAAYDAGPEAIARHGGVPPYPETRNYVDAILGRLAENALETKP